MLTWAYLVLRYLLLWVYYSVCVNVHACTYKAVHVCMCIILKLTTLWLAWVWGWWAVIGCLGHLWILYAAIKKYTCKYMHVVMIWCERIKAKRGERKARWLCYMCMHVYTLVRATVHKHSLLCTCTCQALVILGCLLLTARPLTFKLIGSVGEVSIVSMHGTCMWMLLHIPVHAVFISLCWLSCDFKLERMLFQLWV